MDIQAIWLFVLAVSIPIGGVIGFFLQIQKLNHEKRKNDMLELQIVELKSRIKDAEQVIVRATPEEIKSYGQKIAEPHVMFSRGSPSSVPKSGLELSLFSRLWKSLIPALWVSLALSFFGYVLYDIYRIGRWIFTA